LQTVDPINTIPLQIFIQQVKSAQASQAREVKLDIATANNLAFTLGIVMSRLTEDLEKILVKSKDVKDDEVIQVTMDGGTGWK
jgi:hypothetical protein|tara:strand:+ start:240 stop:488 length:249 start_codon:yes stop_codon:yes gene_type:complete